MADSVPDPKLDDVLSSVRRLVSQEIPKRQQPKTPVDPGALVLTSQDRIEADATARVKERSLEQRIAELEAAVDSGSEEFEPDGSEDQAQHIPDRIVYTRPRPSEEGVGRRKSTLRLSEIALIETGPAQDTDGTADAPIEFRRGGSQPADEAPMAEDVPTLPPVSAEVRAFSDPDDVVARIEARIERGEETEAPEPEPKIEATDEETFDAELTAAVRASVAELVKAEPTDTDRLEAALLQPEPSDSVSAAPEVKSALSTSGSEPAAPHDMAEPDHEAAVTEPTEPVVLTTSQVVTRILEPETADLSPIPENSEVDAAGDAETAARDAASADQDATCSDAAPDGSKAAALEQAEDALGALPNEEAMRLLVARLLREELQGELGERITRNVRKLVRREVMRLMDSRELE